MASDKATRTFKTCLLRWHRGVLRPREQREIAKLLEKPIESRIFEGLPAPNLVESTKDHVCWVRRHDDLRPFFFFVPRLSQYTVDNDYHKAKAESDGQYSPHTALRTLKAGDVEAALDFVNEFGPLELLDESEPRTPIELEDLLDQDEFLPDTQETLLQSRGIWVSLDEFWQKQQRFVAVVELWESRESPGAMRSALSKIAVLPFNPPIGTSRRGDSRVFWSHTLPWRDGYFNAWERQANEKELREAAAEIIKCELTHNAGSMETLWTCSSPSRLQFHLIPRAGSLWSAIWHLFARDASTGLGWRICPHCHKVFYPKRRDSYFCSPKFQKQHAAQRWWDEHSEQELEKRREKRFRMQSKSRRKDRDRSVKDRV